MNYTLAFLGVFSPVVLIAEVVGVVYLVVWLMHP